MKVDLCDRPERNTGPFDDNYGQGGLSDGIILDYRKNPKYLKLAQYQQLIGQECSTNPKSEEEACRILQTENDGLVKGADRLDLKGGDPNYDYKTTAPTKFTEIKVPRDSSLKDAARLGRKAGLQQAKDSNVTLLVNLIRIQPVMGKDCHVRKHHRTRIFLAFDLESGESFTGYQLTKRQSQNHNKYGRIGKNYKN